MYFLVMYFLVCHQMQGWDTLRRFKGFVCRQREVQETCGGLNCLRRECLDTLWRLGLSLKGIVGHLVEGWFVSKGSCWAPYGVLLCPQIWFVLRENGGTSCGGLVCPQRE